MRASSGSGTAPATGPDGAIRYSLLRLSAQRSMTSAASSAAAGTAAAAAAVRQAIATVAAMSTANVDERDRIVPARQHQEASRPRDRRRARPRTRRRSVSASASGPNNRPETISAPPAQIRRRRETHARRSPRPAARFESWKRPERAEHDRGEREPAPHPDAGEHEGGGGHDREVDVERPEIRLLGRDQQRRHIGADEAEPGERRSVQQRGCERGERDDAEQDEGDAGIEEIVERVGRRRRPRTRPRCRRR